MTHMKHKRISVSCWICDFIVYRSFIKAASMCDAAFLRVCTSDYKITIFKYLNKFYDDNRLEQC